MVVGWPTIDEVMAVASARRGCRIVVMHHFWSRSRSRRIRAATLTAVPFRPYYVGKPRMAIRATRMKKKPPLPYTDEPLLWYDHDTKTT